MLHHPYKSGSEVYYFLSLSSHHSVNRSMRLHPYAKMCNTLFNAFLNRSVAQPVNPEGDSSGCCAVIVVLQIGTKA